MSAVALAIEVGKLMEQRDEARALLRVALLVQRQGCDHNGIGKPGCRICDPRVFRLLGPSRPRKERV